MNGVAAADAPSWLARRPGRSAASRSPVGSGKVMARERFRRGMTRVLRCGGHLEAGAEVPLTPFGALELAPVWPGC
ncbi:hypothetical protein GCM10010376_60520 [Streptomyces violaceusniger]